MGDQDTQQGYFDLSFVFSILHVSILIKVLYSVVHPAPQAL